VEADGCGVTMCARWFSISRFMLRATQSSQPEGDAAAGQISESAPTPPPWITRCAPSSPTQGWALGLQIVSENAQRTLLLYEAAGA
jgi:hypothetical protein